MKGVNTLELNHEVDRIAHAESLRHYGLNTVGQLMLDRLKNPEDDDAESTIIIDLEPGREATSIESLELSIDWNADERNRLILPLWRQKNHALQVYGEQARHARYDSDSKTVMGINGMSWIIRRDATTGDQAD